MNNKIFENTEIAFSLKTDKELDKAYKLFKLMANQTLVNLGAVFTTFSFRLNLPIKGIVKNTMFKQFCGGETEEECISVIKKLHTYGVHSILDYSVEGKDTDTDFDAAMRKKIELAAFSKDKLEVPFIVMKPTALGRFDLFVKKSNKQLLSQSEEEEWNRVENRFNAICEAAYNANLQVLIDAEESWMQDAVDNLVERLMMRYNKERITIFNTLQCYRWDRIDYLKELHNRSLQNGYKLGLKIVRGAYMEKERKRAHEKGYISPICVTKEDTDTTFNEALQYILNNIATISLVVGTHNESSVYLAMRLMEKLQLPKNTPFVWFGQLYGMSDHISFNLAKNGYNIVKWIPFGPIREVVPYLIRRAEENTSVAGQTGRELALLKKEKKRRENIT